jgi:hypothetical protein
MAIAIRQRSLPDAIDLRARAIRLVSRKQNKTIVVDPPREASRSAEVAPPTVQARLSGAGACRRDKSSKAGNPDQPDASPR